jgi:hypothetical protein
MLVPSFTEFPMTRSVFPVVMGDHVGAATRAQVGGAGAMLAKRVNCALP